jgi:hypothetical protein
MFEVIFYETTTEGSKDIGHIIWDGQNVSCPDNLQEALGILQDGPGTIEKQLAVAPKVFNGLYLRAEIKKDLSESIRLGGHGSGNFKHKGRPGLRGGSLPKGSEYYQNLQTIIPIEGFRPEQAVYVNRLLTSYPPEHLRGLRIRPPDRDFPEQETVAEYDPDSRTILLALDKLSYKSRASHLNATNTSVHTSVADTVAHEIGHHVTFDLIPQRYRIRWAGLDYASPYWEAAASKTYQLYLKLGPDNIRLFFDSFGFHSGNISLPEEMAAQAYQVWRTGSPNQYQNLSSFLGQDLDHIFNPRYWR